MLKYLVRTLIGFLCGAAFFGALKYYWYTAGWVDRHGNPVTLDGIWLLMLIGGITGAVVGLIYRVPRRRGRDRGEEDGR